MDSTASQDDAWKDLVQMAAKRDIKHRERSGDAAKRLVGRMDELSPFSLSKGIFDNGCGGGNIIKHILDTHGQEMAKEDRDGPRLIAGDFSPAMLGMLKEAKEARISDAGTDGNNDGQAATTRAWSKLEIHQLDAHDLSPVIPESGSISHVTGGHVYFLLPDHRKALRETHRILVPQTGILGLTSGLPSTQHVIALQAAVESVRPGTNLRLIREAWSSEKNIRLELESTGFAVIETFQVSSEFSYETHGSFAKMCLAMPIMKDAIKGWPPAEQEKLLDEVVKQLKNFNVSEPGALQGSSIVVIARAG